MPNLCIIPSRALEDAELTASDMRALLAIGSFTSTRGTGCWAARATIAAAARLDEANYRRSLKKLVARGYVRRESRLRPDGGDSTAMLSIVLDEPPEQLALDEGAGGESYPGGRKLPRGAKSTPGGEAESAPGRGANPTPQTSQSNVLVAAGARELPPAVRLTAAVNAAFDAKLGTNRNPITSGTAANLVEAVVEHSIPLEWAEQHLHAAASAMERAPRSMQYFTPGLLEAWERHQARAAAGAVGDLAARASAHRTESLLIGAQRFRPADFFALCVRHGLAAPMQTRDTIAETVQRLAAQGLVEAPEQFLDLVLHAEPWALAEIKFGKAREERLQAAITSWRPSATVAA